jgi:hypothetical protein
VPTLKQDRYLAPDLEKAARFVTTHDLVEATGIDALIDLRSAA